MVSFSRDAGSATGVDVAVGVGTAETETAGVGATLADIIGVDSGADTTGTDPDTTAAGTDAYPDPDA